MRLESHGLAPGELVARHDPQVRAFMRAMFANPADADDAAQAARIRIDRAASRIGPQAKNYIDRLCRNAGLDTIARRAREPIDLTDDERVYPAHDPFATDERDAAAEQVAAIAAALSPKHFTMLVEREVDGASHAEIAERHGMTPASVRVVLTRARQRARAAVADTAARRLGVLGWWRVWRDRLAEAVRDRAAVWSSFAAPLTDHAAPAFIAAALVVAPTTATHRPRVVVPTAAIVVAAPVAHVSDPAPPAARTTTPTAATTTTTTPGTTTTRPPIARIDTPPDAPPTTTEAGSSHSGPMTTDKNPTGEGGKTTPSNCARLPYRLLCAAMPDE